MEQHLFIILFFTGFAPLVLCVPHKYYLVKQGKTWSDARAYCRATHTDLAIIESNEDMVRLQNEAQRQLFSSSAWIGLYKDINTWRWSMGHAPLGSMSSWTSGQPNNYGGHQECVAIASSGWNDADCTTAYPFVCFDDTSSSQKYIYFSNTKTWHEAQSYCRQYYTDLASSRDSTENSAIAGLTSGLTWFGLFRNAWTCVDQTSLSTISWMTGKPDNALGNENCGYLESNQAADARCSDIRPFFCHSEITGQKQILKVKIRSNQDVNDPAIKAAILEQIKQKLKDHGLAENITVKWREQPDGLVFHKEKKFNTT